MTDGQDPMSVANGPKRRESPEQRRVIAPAAPKDIDDECERLGQMMLACGWRFIDTMAAITHYRFEREHGTSNGASFNEVTRRFDRPDRVTLTESQRLVIIRCHADALITHLRLGDRLTEFVSQQKET